MLIVTGNTVIPPVLRLAEKVSILPLFPQVWAGREEQIQILQPQAPPELGFWETVQQASEAGSILGQEFVVTFFQQARPINGYLLLLEALKKEVDFAGIIVHNDVEPLTRAVCEWGNLNDIPTIHVPHAYYSNVWRDEKGWDPHDVVTATNLAAINNKQMRWYQGLGVRRAKVCGNPVWDAWAEFNLPGVKARRLMGLPIDGRPVVTYMTSWTQETSLFGAPQEFMFNTLAQFAGAVKGLDWHLILKHHPGESQDLTQKHQNIVRNIGPDAVATRENLKLCFAASDVVASFGPSNALIEASILNKPTLCIGEDVPPFPSVPSDPNAISLMLTGMLGDGASKGVRALAPHVGEATAKVAEFIREVCDLDGNAGG